MDNGYEIKKDEAKKRVVITIDGFFDLGSVSAFQKDYEALKKQVNVSETELVLNGKELKAFPKEAESNLKELYSDYTKFKTIYIVKPNALVTKMQVERILKSANLQDKFNFIDSVADL